MKKIIFFLIALSLVSSAQLAFANQGKQGSPFSDLWQVLEERLSLIKADLSVRDEAIEERFRVLEERLDQCGCGEATEMGECTGQEVEVIGSKQVLCGPGDALCFDNCAYGLSLECQSVYQEFRSCVKGSCWFHNYDQEALFNCAQESCSELYDAVYGNYVAPFCGDSICQNNESYSNCSADCNPETVSCGTGACGTTVPFGMECIPSEPSPELCDGVDNDCDGIVDEDFLIPDDNCEGEWVCDHINGLVCA